MSAKLALLAAVASVALTACSDPNILGPQDKTRDSFIGYGDLVQMTAGIWVDPHGCDHWIIDDGAEGYLSARLSDDGKPVCSGTGVPNTATGPFKEGKKDAT